MASKLIEVQDRKKLPSASFFIDDDGLLPYNDLTSVCSVFLLIRDGTNFEAVLIKVQK